MVLVARLLEQEDVRETQEEQRRAQSVEEARRHEERQQSERPEMDDHAVPGPRLDPREPGELEVELGLDPEATHATGREVRDGVPQHQGPESDAEEGQPGRVDGCE